MHDNGFVEDRHTWQAALLGYHQECRISRPVLPRDTLTHEEEACCQLLGGSLITWLQEEFPDIIRQQQAMRLRQANDPLPLVVIATEMAGLVAAMEIIGESDELVCLLPAEYDSWEGKHQDSNYAWHIDYWSAFHPVTVAEWTEVAAEGIDSVEQADARWHIVGCLWGAQAGHEETHLWEWTGDELALVAPGYREVVY